MSELEQALSWTNLPVPEVLRELNPGQQERIGDYLKTLVGHKTEGFDELYQAISMIVKYIPHFIVVPLMVEHIKPQIAAGVCQKMGVDQATGYANELPMDYFVKVSQHIDAVLMAEILEKMKRHHAEKFIHYELQHHLTHILDISEHLSNRMLETVAKHVTLPEHPDDLLNNSYSAIIEKIRALQK
jgi:hypothetical protein